jgi:hypothetical protein
MIQPFRMYEVTLRGPARERGRAHGEAVRGPIIEAIGAFSEALGSAVHVHPAEIYRRMLAETHFHAAAERWTPELIEETRGIGEGAGIDFDTIMAWQFVQEVMWFVTDRFPAAPSVLSCTALGSCPSNGPTILAQTADNPPFIFGRQTLLHLTDDRGIKSHVLTFPGIVGVYGLNDRGIGVCINAMVPCMAHSPAGLGASFIARGILAQSSFESAEWFIRGVPHASGNNFTIGGPGRVVAYECSANRVKSYMPETDAPITYHTNHPLANDDTVEFDNPLGLANSTTRFDTVRRYLEESPQPVTWERVRDILSSHDDADHPICRHPGAEDGSVTCFGIIMECAPEPILHLSSGPPCCTEFRDFAFA